MADRRTLTVRYYNREGTQTHSYVESWDKTDYHCPHCGGKSVWVEDGYGDYHLGPRFLCHSCGGCFFMPEPADPENAQDKQRLAELTKEE